MKEDLKKKLARIAREAKINPQHTKKMTEGSVDALRRLTIEKSSEKLEYTEPKKT